MKYQWYIVLLVILTACSGTEKTTELVFSSWRTDDEQQMNEIIAAFEEAHPNISVRFDPINPPDYNPVLRLRLENDEGPDLFYARSYDTGRQLFRDGFIRDIQDLKFISERYTASSKDPWTMDTGELLAMPFLAVSHGVYYNKDIFSEFALSIPQTWEELLSVAQKLKSEGITPFSNGLADQWDIAEVVFMNIAPNFIGGEEGRLAYDAGTRRFDDQAVIDTFAAMDSLQAYLPEGYEALSYNDSKAFFLLGDAAMMFDGSWTIAEHLGTSTSFEWGVFAPPPPADAPGFITFHPDSGIAINASSQYAEEAEIFLRWISDTEGSKIVADQLPGFFPMLSETPALSNPQANEFLSLNRGKGLDVRWPWPHMMNGDPSGYNLIMDGSIAVLTDQMTPIQAAQFFSEGLAKWYAPAQR